ncbi:hypothetical protein D3C85_1843370 [compost metagenome]
MLCFHWVNSTRHIVIRPGATVASGAYAKFGAIAGAGSNRGLAATTYVGTLSGKLYFRADADFNDYIVRLLIEDAG